MQEHDRPPQRRTPAWPAITLACLGLLAIVVTLLPRHRTWLFQRDGNVEQWVLEGLDLSLLNRQGITFRGEAGGTLRSPPLELPASDIRQVKVEIGSTRAMTGAFTWTSTAGGASSSREVMQFPMKQGQNQRFTFAVAEMTTWLEEIQELAFTFPDAAEITVYAVSLVARSPLARLRQLWDAYWTLDEFTPATINLLNGPHLVTNPLDLPSFLDTTKVYRSTSAGLLWYIAIGVVALIGIAVSLTTHLRSPLRTFVLPILTTIAVLWVVADVRMGIELLSYAKTDWKTYVRQPQEQRQFRDRERLYDFAEFAGRILPPGITYNLIVPRSWPYVGIIRYATVPSIPVEVQQPDQAISRYWVFYNIDGVATEGGSLLHRGQVLRSSGTLLGFFANGSLIYRE